MMLCVRLRHLPTRNDIKCAVLFYIVAYGRGAYLDDMHSVDFIDELY